jgi:hypothetical protein
MQPVVVVAIVVGVLVLAVIGGALLVGRNVRRQREQRRGVLESLGLTVVSEKPFKARGRYRDAEVSVEQTDEVSRRATLFATRVVLAGGEPVETVVQKRFGSSFEQGRATGLEEVETGHEEFDERFRTFARDEAATAMWRDEVRCERVLALGRQGRPGELVELTASDGEVMLLLAGADLYPETLQAAMYLAADVARVG